MGTHGDFLSLAESGGLVMDRLSRGAGKEFAALAVVSLESVSQWD
jgi:hypothetical protein